MARKKTGAKGTKGTKKSAQATVKVVPTQGRATESSVAVPKGGLTVGAALQAAGVSADRKNLSVGGQPATLDQKLSSGDTLTVEERPQGS